MIFRVIDTETTSFEGSVLEIASVDIVDGKICNPMSDFVKPTEAISFEAMAIHHITENMVADAPLIEHVIDRYLDADIYVAHNAAFDREKLPQITAPWVCTLKLSRKLWPEGGHGNQYLRYAHGLNPDVPEGLHAHRALYDCYVTAELLLHMNRIARWTVAEMREITKRPSLLHAMAFGKHKGKTFTDIASEDPGYFRWCLSNMELNEDQEYTMKHAMGAIV
ncbi:exodeoxyribonuclease X [Yersinia ruckeri]|uniref:exodeoxyribonuclease X n=1 Tax=Yersinia ruckeri TaxID=29486 RepID=UPI0020BE2C2F|nr:exodeoxyribonuclease X [Yersinia ruckeri]MCK8571310.1 exodeoxyribonuclease X [Yersinia ruckeri]MCK8577687.1 exodeoxyribonuclease X [Yersinia ruckeri]MCK8581438.1 exodeoxyribonuclease X [Yersinia ruckeri]MCW6600768.1 exodeoxyribonuclease X [Yersinia ruckeri]UZX52883.1 exodeoxyribonuclease X [Yersinia ruckeri]